MAEIVIFMLTYAELLYFAVCPPFSIHSESAKKLRQHRYFKLIRLFFIYFNVQFFYCISFGNVLQYKL